MPESGTFGSVRGVPGNGHPYRDRRAYSEGVQEPVHHVERHDGLGVDLIEEEMV